MHLFFTPTHLQAQKHLHWSALPCSHTHPATEQRRHQLSVFAVPRAVLTGRGWFCTFSCIFCPLPLYWDVPGLQLCSSSSFHQFLAASVGSLCCSVLCFPLSAFMSLCCSVFWALPPLPCFPSGASTAFCSPSHFTHTNLTVCITDFCCREFSQGSKTQTLENTASLYIRQFLSTELHQRKTKYPSPGPESTKSSACLITQVTEWFVGFSVKAHKIEQWKKTHRCNQVLFYKKENSIFSSIWVICATMNFPTIVFWWYNYL